MHAHFPWRIFESDGKRVEGHMFIPEHQTRDLILFCPGFPGAGATMFEQRHVITLMSEGYTVAVLRHNGTRLDTQGADFMVNNSGRMGAARKHGHAHLGGGPATMEDLLLEPLVALRDLSGEYSGIHVLGNSFGALAALWSLSRADAPRRNVISLTCLAGAQGISDDSTDDIMRIWKTEFLESPGITDHITIDSAQAAHDTLRELYAELPYCARDLPDFIRLAYLVVEHDELFTRRDTERFMDATDGRGTLVMDTIDRAVPAHNLGAHYMPSYPTEYLIDLIEGKYPVE